MNIIQVPAYFFTAGRSGATVDTIAIHWMDTTLAGADATFTGGQRQASAHYGVENEVIHQYVSENDTAWSCGDWPWNLRTISIEHSAQPGRDATDATYTTSAQLIADICTRHGITPSATTILPHYHFTNTDCSGTIDIPRLIRTAQTLMNGENEMTPADLLNYPAYDGGPTVSEVLMHAEAVYQGIYVGGESTPGKKPLIDLWDGIPVRTANVQVTGRPTGPVSWIQDTANGTTAAASILATVAKIATKIGA